MGKLSKPITTIHVKGGLNLVESYSDGKKLFSRLWELHKWNQREIEITFGHKLYDWITNGGNKRMHLVCDNVDITHFDKFDKLTGKIQFDIRAGIIWINVTNLIKCA